MTSKKQIGDGLTNVVANLGTARDKASHTQYVSDFLSPADLLTAYRTSWLCSAIVDYPAEDATRKWRSWRAEADQIEKIEETENRLHVKLKVQEAMVAARLYGGAAIYMNTGESLQASKFDPKKEIKSLVVLTSNTLTAGTIVRDIDSIYYGRPEFYTLSSNGQKEPTKIHASRLVIFSGVTLPEDLSSTTQNRGWGDSVLQSTMDAIKNTDSTMANMASLVFEAKVDVLKFEGFAALLAAEGGDAKVGKRLSAQAAMKGINGALVIDKLDDYDQKNANFSGLPDVVNKFVDVVSGASRIPVTRLFGRAAAGLSGSGDGDERVYFDRIGHIQATKIQPAMGGLDEALIWMALGSRPPEIYYQWAPLRQMSEAERADIFSKTATAARALAGTNAGELIPLDALSEALVNELTEQGMLPGLDQAIKEFGSLAEQNEYVETEELAPVVEALPVTATDAAPMTLYVSRKITNARAILKHYKDQGVTGLVSPGDMHVTVTHSRNPVNWFAMGEPWSSNMTLVAGGARVTELFGPNKNALVLSFKSSELTWRHDAMIESGATWDWSDYQPHITLSYEFSGKIDEIEPWQGEIKMGPEVFEEINDEYN